MNELFFFIGVIYIVLSYLCMCISFFRLPKSDISLLSFSEFASLVFIILVTPLMPLRLMYLWCTEKIALVND